MEKKIRIAIAGYGNIGKGVEQAIGQNDDMELVAIVTRRDPQSLTPFTQGVAVVHEDCIAELVGKVDVMILCGGSATDLPKQGPTFAAMFNTVDSFDNHANIPAYFAQVDKAAKDNGNLSLISCGWDPGLFSIMRAYGSAVLPQGDTYTFWGKGVSQGHSDAIRRIEGVADAKQYTVPVQTAIDAVRSGTNPTFTTREKHLRDCYVVVTEGADCAQIEKEIVTMPNYFADYDTTVTFVTQEELDTNHKAMPHGGFVFRSGETGVSGHKHVIEYSLKLDSNPEFTSSALIANTRAIARMWNKGQTGCVTVLDIPPAMLCKETPEMLRASLV